MNCFKHNDRSAVGLCKSCGKGLCSDCATELVNGLACKGECESRVQLINKIIDTNSQYAAAARYQTKTSGVFILLFGAAFLFFAVLCYVTGEDMVMAAFFGVAGGALILHGFQRLSRKSEYPSVDSEGTKN